MENKKITIFMNEGGSVQAVELELNGVLHCTADIRERTATGCVVVCSHITEAAKPHSLYEIMRELVKIDAGKCVEMQAKIVKAGRDAGRGQDWVVLEHPEFANLKY